MFRINDFLQIHEYDWEFTDNKIYFSGDYTFNMKPEIYRILENYYKESNQKLLKCFNIDYLNT